MSQNLQYNYAQIDPSTNQCRACFTCSYEIPLPEYIPVPEANDDYYGKYYNRDTDLWYIDAEMTVLADDVNAMYHG